MTETPRITFLGQSGFLIETSESTLLLDPSNKKSGEFEGDIVYCTHYHFDHIGGVKSFMNRNADAVLVGNEQVTNKFPEYEDRVITCSDGQKIEENPWTFKFTRLKHGIFGGVVNLGVVVNVDDFSFAHCGDAVSFEGFPSSTVDVLAIPISGAFAASPKIALKMVQSLSEPLPIIVPIHWLFRNPEGFCKKLSVLVPTAKCVIPQNGKPLQGYE
ncbi:MAG: MBL fold metallo-hydrolase [Candidatus Thorarchaeota archaeon]